MLKPNKVVNDIVRSLVDEYESHDMECKLHPGILFSINEIAKRYDIHTILPIRIASELAMRYGYGN